MRALITVLVILITNISLSQVKVEYYNHWDEITRTVEYKTVEFKPNKGDFRLYIRIDGEEHSRRVKTFPTEPYPRSEFTPTWIVYICYQSTINQPVISIMFNTKENKVKYLYKDGSYVIYSGAGLKYPLPYWCKSK